jgi:Family of unknown function (DUF6492)
MEAHLNMLVALHYCRKEEAQAKQLASWIKELGPYPNHSLLVAVDHRAGKHIFSGLGFASEEEFTISDDAWNEWPRSPNNAFRHIAKHIEYGSKEPWLWIEVDAVPLKKGWLDKIEAEYKTAAEHGKVFLGDHVHTGEAGFIDHMSGVAVYPGLMSNHAGEALLAHEHAWDVQAAHQILPKMMKSKSILHRWKYPAFENWEQVEKRIFAVKPECVLFHSDKKMSLITLLSLSKTATLPTETLNQIHDEIININNRPVCDIFIKSFHGDYEWLTYCLRSIAKFATGFRRRIVVAPDEEWKRMLFGAGEIKTVVQRESENGYLFQQVCKLNADQYTDADFVLFMDSDCVFTRPVTPETFMRNGKPIWLMTPFDKAREDQRAAWVPVMTKWMNKVPEYEFMRRHPFMFPSWFFEKIRGFCANEHGVTLDDYIMHQPRRSFSEFNCAGFLAYEHFRDRFDWINTETDEVPPETVLQNWSPGGLTEGIEAELERLLKGGADEKEKRQEKGTEAGILTGFAPTFNPKSATASTATSIVSELNGDTSRPALIRDAVAVLKQLAGTAPRHISQVRKELKAQGVIR